MVKEYNTCPISTRNKIDTVGNTEISQTYKETVDTPKDNELTHLTQYINQGLLQELICLIKVPKQKTPPE